MSRWTRATVRVPGLSPQQVCPGAGVSRGSCVQGAAVSRGRCVQGQVCPEAAVSRGRSWRQRGGPRPGFSQPFLPSPLAVASDRVSIHSLGHMTPILSPQNLLSCDTHHQKGCRGGRLDGAWWFLRRRGYATGVAGWKKAKHPTEPGRCGVTTTLWLLLPFLGWCLITVTHSPAVSRTTRPAPLLDA